MQSKLESLFYIWFSKLHGELLNIYEQDVLLIYDMVSFNIYTDDTRMFSPRNLP